MESQKRKIEVFTAGCPVCEPVVEMVKSLACCQNSGVTEAELRKAGIGQLN